MDMSDKDKFEIEKSNPSNFHSSRVSLDWDFSTGNFTNTTMGLVPISDPMEIYKGDLIGSSSSCSSAFMLDSHCPPWDHALISQNLGLCNINVENTSTRDFGWDPRSSMLPNVRGVIPHILPHFPTDSGFIERAAKFSCFNGGIFNNMVTPFSIQESLSPHLRSRDEAKQGINVSSNVSDETALSGGDHTEPSMLEEGGTDREPSAMGGLRSKKRKIRAQKPELDQVKEMSVHSGEPANDDNKNTGKLGSQASDSYVHVRARRGQATNSHSLAERVRREKISERMKLLQDLVPGCNKVTGKAVMLDEIINYVQSLQRQVEFLSMKLATVNPQLDFTIDGLRSHDAPSSSIGFSRNANMTTYPTLLHTSQPGLIQRDLPYMRNSLLTAINGGYKEPTPLIPNSWEDELHNVVQMGFGPSTPTENQDLSNGDTKIER